MRKRVVFVDVDDTLIRSVGTKRVPMPGRIFLPSAAMRSGTIERLLGPVKKKSNLKVEIFPKRLFAAAIESIAPGESQLAALDGL